MLTIVLAVLISTHSVGQLMQAQAKPESYQCFTKSLGKMLYAMEERINGHRINTQAFDRDGDGEPDVLLGYEYVGTKGQLRPFPTLYIFDFESEKSVEYIDAKGDGRCADMAQIPVGSAFTGKRL